MPFNGPRAFEYMRASRLDALVATSAANVAYFTGYSCWLDTQFKEYMAVPGGSNAVTRTAWAVLPLDGAPSLVIHALFACNAGHWQPHKLHTFGDAGYDLSDRQPDAVGHDPQQLALLNARAAGPDTLDGLVEAVRANGLSNGRIGIEMDALVPPVQEAIRQVLPHADVRDCSNVIRLIRMVKGPEELEHLRMAAQIAEDAAAASLALARPGVPIRDVARHFRTEVVRRGAEFDHFAFGLNGMGIATEPEYMLRAEDVMYIDFGCIYCRYFSDAGTTLALAPLSPTLERKHLALRSSISAAAETLQPGVKASAISAAMWRAVQNRGITQTFPHGHGIGLELRDYPIIVPDNGGRIRDECVDLPSDLPVEAGMVVNFEAGMFLPGTASLQVEQSFVVTENGSVPLVPQERMPFQPVST